MCCVACASGRSGALPPTSGPTVAPSATPAPFVGSSGLTFTSNRSVLLSAVGQTYQLLVAAPGGVPVAYSSTNTAIATVTSGGLVTASGAGIATILVTAGSNADTATVLVKQTGPNTTPVSDANVVAASDTQVVLKAGAEASAIKAGQIVVSGDSAGVLAQVTAVSAQGSQVVLSVTPATLAQAFPNTNANVVGAAQHAVMTLQHGVGTLRLTNGGVAPRAINGAVCSVAPGGSPGTVQVANSNITVNVDVAPVFDFTTSNGAVQSFELGAKLVATVQGATGDLSRTATGTVTFTCAVPSYAIPVPVVAFGPLIMNFTASNQYGIRGTLGATVGDTIAGPTVAAAFSGEEGVAYRNGAWSQIETGRNTGSLSLMQVDPAQRFTSSLQGSFGPFDTAGIGLGFALGSRFVTLLNVQLLSSTAYATFDVGITSTHASGAAAYAAPSWDGRLGVDVALDPKLSGALPQLVKKIVGIGIDLGSFSLYKSEATIAGSPTVNETLTAVQDTPCTAQLAASVTDGNLIKQSYAGDQVQFVAIAGPNAPASIASGTASGDATGSSVTVPSPTMSPGTYSIVAHVYDGVFGRADLPYTSSPQQITIQACASPTPTPSPSPSPPSSSSALTAQLANVTFIDSRSAVGSFDYDPVTRRISRSSVALGDIPLTDSAHSAINEISVGTVTWYEFVLVNRTPNSLCSRGMPCGTSYIGLSLPSLPTGPGVYTIPCGLCDQNPAQNNSYDIIDKVSGSALNSRASLLITAR